MAALIIIHCPMQYCVLSIIVSHLLLPLQQNSIRCFAARNKMRYAVFPEALTVWRRALQLFVPRPRCHADVRLVNPCSWQNSRQLHSLTTWMLKLNVSPFPLRMHPHRVRAASPNVAPSSLGPRQLDMAKWPSDITIPHPAPSTRPELSECINLSHGLDKVVIMASRTFFSLVE